LDVWDLRNKLDDFAADAVFLDHSDLAITIDTAMCHLAGAMAKPTWTLLTYTAEWRFGLHLTDCVWYPTMRLFRQPKPGDWRSVIDEVRGALARLAAPRP